MANLNDTVKTIQAALPAIAETAVATVAHAIVAADGTILQQVTAAGLLVGPDGTSPVGGVNNPTTTVITPTAGVASYTVNPALNHQLATMTVVAATALTITGLTSGMAGTIYITQGNGSGNTTTITPTPKVSGGGAGVIGKTTANGAIDSVSWRYVGTTLFCTATVLNYT